MVSIDLGGLATALKTVIGVLAAVAAVAGVGLLLLHSSRLGVNADNPQRRGEAMASLWQVLVGMFFIFISAAVAGFVLWLVKGVSL